MILSAQWGIILGMTSRRFLFSLKSLILGSLALTILSGTSAEARSTPPTIGAKRAIVIDYRSGKILFAKNAHQKCAVASTQKLLTALCVLDAGSLRDSVTIQQSDTYCEPTKLYLKPGQRYTRKDLLQVLIVKSANDVARALARDVSGSQTAFSKYMNRKAKQLGMHNSNFINPNGLTVKGQYSTAYDVAIMSRNAYSRPEIREMMKIQSYHFRYSNGSKKLLKNTNRLLGKNPYCNGMKTGTTRASGRCLVSSGTHNGRTVIAVVLGATSSTIWTDSERLLNWGLGL
ncbi:D-alanyl-D-alanine carboxypeptidase family protein [Rubritalea marina]|uniref:D-alanyl-D-alanine carboxypeptidase family protein n=1 Tax=Rubritalea marina TaxID=361055 RepID=UPI0014614D70|nr:D-alanyl-D-alanine carboxypeptidase family protein [Rubritalea marina]